MVITLGLADNTIIMANLIDLSYNIGSFNCNTINRSRYCTIKDQRIKSRYDWIKQLIIFNQLKSLTQ